MWNQKPARESIVNRAVSEVTVGIGLSRYD